MALDPYDAAAHTGLGRLAMKKNQAEIAVREFKAAMALRPADRAAAHCDLGEALLAVGAPPTRNAKRWPLSNWPRPTSGRRNSSSKPFSRNRSESRAMTSVSSAQIPLAAAAALLLWLVASVLVPPADAQVVGAPDSRFAGLQWTFARIRYQAWSMPPSRFTSPEDEPWFIDAPAAEQNLSRRIRTVTSIQVNDPVVITLEDPSLWSYPWIYIVEPGTCG